MLNSLCFAADNSHFGKHFHTQSPCKLRMLDPFCGQEARCGDLECFAHYLRTRVTPAGDLTSSAAFNYCYVLATQVFLQERALYLRPEKTPQFWTHQHTSTCVLWFKIKGRHYGHRLPRKFLLSSPIGSPIFGQNKAK